MNTGHLGHRQPHQPPTDDHTPATPQANGTTGASTAPQNPNAARRAGMTGRDLARLAALARLEGQPLVAIPRAERAVHVDPRDVQGSHRAHAAAALEGRAPPAPSSARPQPTRTHVVATAGLEAAMAALEDAVRAYHVWETEAADATPTPATPPASPPER